MKNLFDKTSFYALCTSALSLIFFSCTNSNNGRNNQEEDSLSIGRSNEYENSGKKVFPPKDIESPVAYSEYYDFRQDEGYAKNGQIVSIDQFSEYQKTSYDSNGYAIRVLTEYGSDGGYSDDWEGFIDLSDDKFTYKYGKSSDGTNDKYVYNEYGNLYKVYIDDKLVQEIEYDSKNREKLKILYDLESNTKYKTTTIYENNIKKVFESSSDNENEEGSYYTYKYSSNGKLEEKKEYYSDGKNKKLVSCTTYTSGGKFAETTDEDGRKFKEEYNNKGDVIRAYIDGELVTEYTRKYDKYGNPTLVINKSVDCGEIINSIEIWNYTYNDGTKFIAKEEYPELFAKKGSNSSSSSSSSSDTYYTPHVNMNNGYNGYNSSNSTINSTHQREMVREWKDCSYCRGNGRVVRDSYQSTYGMDDPMITCPECYRQFHRSTGHTHIDCPECHGSRGRYVETYK